MKCPVCSTELPSTARFCGSCGTTLAPAPPPPPPVQPIYEQAPPVYEQTPPMISAARSYGGGPLPAVEKKYRVLRLIAVLIKVLAFVGGTILIIAGVVALVAGVTSSSRTSAFETGPTALLGGVVGGLFFMVYGVFVFVFLYAYSEWMYVFMDIEENTRITNEMLSGRR